MTRFAPDGKRTRIRLMYRGGGGQLIGGGGGGRPRGGGTQGVDASAATVPSVGPRVSGLGGRWPVGVRADGSGRSSTLARTHMYYCPRLEDSN